jgi:Damage-control phosphatase ARMT1-like domain
MAVIEAGQKFVLADDTAELSRHVASLEKSSRYDVIVDNAGFELFCDLCLADFLVSSGYAKHVHLHLKSHPTFVSDAMAKDVAGTIDFMRRGDGSLDLATSGARWACHVKSGAWILAEDDFWVQPCAMWLMPKRLVDDLKESSLVFVKGDANYRRLLGDRSWQLDTPFGDIVCYFPAPICALRTLKAEIGCGLPPATVTDAIAAKDPTWLVSGKYGVVQFLDPRGSEVNAVGC